MKFSAAIPAMTLPLVAVVAHAHLSRAKLPEDPAPKQIEAPEAPPAPVIPAAPPVAAPAPQIAELPADTAIPVTPLAEITSDHMKKGDIALLQIASDVSKNGTVVIPRGSPVKATVTLRSGKGLFGKNAKFEITFNSVTIAGVEYPLKGLHHQEGRGAEGKAKSDILSGAAAVMVPGQVATAVTVVGIKAGPPQASGNTVTTPQESPSVEPATAPVAVSEPAPEPATVSEPAATPTAADVSAK